MPVLQKFNIRVLISILVMGTFVVAAKPQGSVNVQKIPEAGIQFTVPAGWSVEKDKNGTVTVSKKENDGYVVIALTSLPTDPSLTLDKEFTLFSQGILDSVKKDWKTYKVEDVARDSQNGMSLIIQPFSGTAPDAGGELEGLVIVMGAANLSAFSRSAPKNIQTRWTKKARTCWVASRRSNRLVAAINGS